MRSNNDEPSSGSLFLFSALTLLSFTGCKSDPPDIVECEATSDGGTGCDPEPPPEPDPECAEPVFEGMHPTAITYECEGQAGGAIIYNQVEYDEDKAGPGSIPAAPEGNEEPEWTPFPSKEHTVSACCHGEQDLQEIQSNACERDCGRAACNDVLERLRATAMQSDPSSGACDPLTFDDLIQGCQDRVGSSIESWIVQLEARYEECVDAAVANDDPDWPYWEHDFPIAAELIFEDWGCSTNAIGCLYSARLRPFCQITDVTAMPTSTCEQAGNVEDPEADGDGGADETGAGDGGAAPFGDVSELVYCSPQTTCTIAEDLYHAVFYNYHVFFDEEVALVPVSTPTRGFRVTGLDSGEAAKELLDEFGIVNDDVITHVDGTPLNSTANIDEAIEAIATQSAWTVTVRRWNGSSWATLEYSIAIAVSFGGPLHRDEDRGDGPSGIQAAASENDPASCSCRADQDHGAPALLLLTLPVVFRRRRRWIGA